MENTLSFILGAIMISLGIVWYLHERRKFLKQRKEEDYMMMSFGIEFIAGSLILIIIGIKLIYDSF